MFKRPLLAPSNSPQDTPDFFKKLPYPIFGSPKLDGIRGVPRSRIVLSRTLKKLPNKQVQRLFGGLPELDGEVIEGRVTDFDVYNRTQSYVMSEDKEGDASFHVFDVTFDSMINDPFHERFKIAERTVAALNLPNVLIVPHHLIESEEELLAYEDEQLELGFEGVMLRNPVGRYKTTARCTWKEAIIFKLKRFADDEAQIKELVEREINNNEQERDERGYAKRSTKKENMVKAGTTGKFRCLYKGDMISVAPGYLKHKRLQEIWDNWDNPEKTCRDKFIKFRHFPKGQKDKPRHPRCIGFRDEMDM